MAEIESKKVFDYSTGGKNKYKDFTKKNKKGLTENLSKINQTPKELFSKLNKNSKNKTSDIKQVDAPRQCILKDNSSIQLEPEENEYKIQLIKRPELPALIESIWKPKKIEDTFQQYLTQNKVKREDIDSIEKIVSKMKGTESSDDVVIKLYNLCAILSDENKKNVTNKSIISYLVEPTRGRVFNELICLNVMFPFNEGTNDFVMHFNRS